MTTTAGNVIGIDVGGTKIAAGWVTFPDATIRLRRTIPTAPERGGAAVLDDVVALARELIAEAQTAGARIDAMGLGLCELVDASGQIRSANCVSWIDQPVQDRLAMLIPSWIEADVRAAARAEALFGAGRSRRLFLYVTVGTGISCSLVIDGEPLTGARGATGTMASAPWTTVCEDCGKVSRQALEQIAAGPALRDRYHQRRPGSARTGQDVLAAALAGDADAEAVARSSGEALGATVGWLVNVLDPELVIVGGGLGLSDGPYWESFVDATRRHVWSELHRELPIVHAATGLDAGWLGAAATAWRRLGTGW